MRVIHTGLLLVLASLTIGVSAGSASQIYWGAQIDGDVYSANQADAPYSEATWKTFSAHAGKAPSIIKFLMPPPWVQNFSKSPLESTRALGAIPLVDMASQGASLAELAAGSKDASIANWANAAKGYGRPFFLRFDWNMNSSEFLWGKEAFQSPGTFVAAWRHLHDIFVQQGATNVTWVWSPTVLFPGSTSLSQLYPGNTYVDWTGVDGLNYGTNPIGPKTWGTFSQIFSSTYTKLLEIAPTKPIMVGEVASTEIGGSKAQWIKDAFGSNMEVFFPRIEAVSWFNWNIATGKGRWDWPIESSASAQAAFAERIASNYYAGNVFGSLTGLAPVQPLP